MPRSVSEPTINEVVRNLFGEAKPGQWIGAVEAGLGLVVMGFFAFVLVLICGPLVLVNAWLYRYPRIDPPALVALAPLWAALVWLEMLGLRFFTDRLARSDASSAVPSEPVPSEPVPSEPVPSEPVPIPVRIATRQPSRSFPVRVVVAAWWIAHAVAVVAVAEWVVGRVSFFRPTAAERLLEVAVPLLFLFGAAFAMNTHLLIALFALTRSETLVRRVHAFRLVLDLTVVFVVPKLVPLLLAG